MKSNRTYKTFLSITKKMIAKMIKRSEIDETKWRLLLFISAHLNTNMNLFYQ